MMRSEVSIRGQIRFLALGVALPLAALTVLIIATDFRNRVDAARLEVDRLASVTAAGAAQFVRDVDEVGRRIAASPEIRSLESGECEETLRPLVNALEHFTTLQVMRVGGDIVCSVPQRSSEVDRDPSDGPWVRAVVATGEPAFGPPALGPDARTSITSVTFPIKDSESAVIGLLGVELGMAQMQELVSSNPSDGRLLTLTDTASVVLARSQDPEQWIARRLPAAPSEDETVDLSLPSGFNTTTAADGVERLFAYRRVEGSPWVVWAGTPTDLIYGPIWATLYPKLGLAALVMMFVTLLAWALNRRIGSSLAGLVDDMRAVEERAGALVPETGPAEVSEVARQYNRMLVERRGAEAEAAVNADLHQLLMHASNDAVWDWDLRADVIDANRQFFELFGGGPYEPLGGEAFWASRIHPEDAESVRKGRLGLIAEGDDNWTQEYRVRSVDGAWTEVLDRSYVLRDETDEPIRLVGTIMDITEQRREQRAVQKAKERYESILNNAVFGIYVAALDGRVLEANPALLSMLGIEDTGTELNERSFYARGQDRDSEVEAVLSKQLAGPLEVTWKTSADDTLYVRLFRSLFTDERGATVLEVIAEDLTERRDLEEQFRQAQKMEAMGRLAGGVAHDFNNRLTVIRGRAQLLKDEPGMDADAMESLDAILESADGAAKLTNELLAVSRKQVFRPKTISVGELVSRLRPMFDTLLGETIRVETDLPESLPNVSADPGQLEQILINLLVNAADAIPGGGLISIETARKFIDESEAHSQAGLLPGDYVALRVQDDGMGISPEVLERVFEPFFTTKPVGQGTGLGLATVYGLIKQNGGFVSIASEVDVGTTVELLLPVVEGAVARDPKSGIPAIPGGTGYNVLVVEDEEGVRLVASRTLRRFGYHVLEAESAEEALAMTDEALDDIDLIVTDVVMTGLRGTDLADRFQQRKPGLPVLFISGYTDEGPLLDNDDARRRAFLAKPFAPHQLGMAVAGLLARSSHLGPDATVLHHQDPTVG